MSILLAILYAVSLSGMHLHDDFQDSQTYKPSSMAEALADTPVVEEAVYTVSASVAERMTQQLSPGAHVKVLMVYIGAVGSERVFGLEDVGNGQRR